jgi:hypothetical protein
MKRTKSNKKSRPQLTLEHVMEVQSYGREIKVDLDGWPDPNGPDSEFPYGDIVILVHNPDSQEHAEQRAIDYVRAIASKYDLTSR